MTDTVLKAFNTPQRRYVPGDELSGDENLQPHDLADLKRRKFVGTSKAGGKPAEAPAE